MSETNQNFPIYFNGYIGNGESMKKIAESLSKDSNQGKTFDFDKHRYLLCGNPFLFRNG
jgi:hypothetical protein